MKRLKNIFIITSIIVAIFLINKVYAEEAQNAQEAPNKQENINIIGDLNNDNKISVTDLSIFKSHFVGLTLITDETKLKKCDLNNDGKVSILDLALLRSKLIGVTEEFITTGNEEVIKYLEKNSQFISEFEFSDPSKLELNINNTKLLNYLYGNSIEELNLTVEELIEIGESLGYNLDKIKNLNLPLINLSYLYNDSLFNLVFSMESFRKIITKLGYDVDELYNYLQNSTPYISTIKQIKENYYYLFGKDIPEEFISEIKNSKNYLPKYDAIFYTKPRTSFKTYSVNNISGEIIDNKYNLKIDDEQIKSNITLKRDNNSYYFVSIEK